MVMFQAEIDFDRPTEFDRVQELQVRAGCAHSAYHTLSVSLIRGLFPSLNCILSASPSRFSLNGLASCDAHHWASWLAGKSSRQE
jgi:hypothetical protein